MRITLTDFVKQHYRDIDFCGVFYNKEHNGFKQYLRCGVCAEDAEDIANLYDNLKVVTGFKQYAPEIKTVYITLK